MLRNYAVFVVLLSTLFSCKKERSFEAPATGTPVVGQQWQFSEGGAAFGGPMDSASILSIGLANSLSLYGTSTDGKGEISLQILSNGNFVKGDYKNPQILFQYALNGSTSLQNTSTDDFTITITAIDSFSVTGVFLGVASDSAGNKQKVSSGKFTAAIKKISSLPTGRGTLTVWSKQLCGGGGSIYIRVGDSVSAITQAMATEPSCGAPGAVSFSLPSGPYTVIAACGSDTLMLPAAVLPGVCATVEVDFSQLANQDYFPMQTRWSYGNVDDYDNDTLAISSVGDTAIGADTFTKFYNDKTGETNYYRKTNGIYYQYLLSAYGKPLGQPLQIIILQDNKALNSAWESDPYNVDFGSAGIPFTLTVKLRSTISKQHYSATVGGKTYTDCSEVTSELYQQTGTGWQDADTGFVTVFAKGVGIISYQDLNAGTDWQIRNYQVAF